MKKILVIFFLILIIFNTKVFAKYKLNFKIQCFEIIVDNESPTFEVNYSSKNWTNQNVTVKVKPSEIVENIEGFEYVDGIYQRIVQQNEIIEIGVKDLFGNEGILNYSVENIDKTPPYIIGIEDGGKYNEIKEVEFKDDESGIQKINKLFYGDLLIDSNIIQNTSQLSINVIRHPKNIVNYKYYRIENGKENYIISNLQNLFFNMNKDKNCSYYVVGIDNQGCFYKSNIISKENYLNQYHIQESENIFSKSGWYDITVFDNAGNFSTYTISFDI